MNKQHFKPEFTVIRQNEANAKFFVPVSDPTFAKTFGLETTYLAVAAASIVTCTLVSS